VLYFLKHIILLITIIKTAFLSKNFNNRKIQQLRNNTINKKCGSPREEKYINFTHFFTFSACSLEQLKAWHGKVIYIRSHAKVKLKKPCNDLLSARN